MPGKLGPATVEQIVLIFFPTIKEQAMQTSHLGGWTNSHRLHRSRAIAILLLLPCWQGRAQTWERIAPQAPAANVVSIATDPDDTDRILVASDPTGPWDNLASGGDLAWTQILEGSSNILIPGIHVMRTYVGETTAFVLAEQGHVYFSVNGGAWQENEAQALFTRALAVNPADEGHVLRAGNYVHENGNIAFIQYADDAAGGCEGTFAFGATSIWCPTMATPPSPNTNLPSAAGYDLITDVEFAPLGDVVWAATSVCWTGYQDHCGNPQSDNDPAMGVGLLWSDDGGITWNGPVSVSTGGERNKVNNIAVIDGDTVLAATKAGLYLCEDCTSVPPDWSQITIDGASGVRVNDVFYASPTVFAATNAGVFMGSLVSGDLDPTCFEADPVCALGGDPGDPNLLYAGYCGQGWSPPGVCAEGDNRLFEQHPPREQIGKMVISGSPTCSEIAGAHDGYSVQSILVHPDDDQTAYFSTACQAGVLRWTEPASTASLSDWSNFGLHYPMRLAADPDVPDALWTAYDRLRYFDPTITQALRAQEDQGEAPASCETSGSWTPAGPTGPDLVHVHAIDIARADSNLWYIGSGFGLWPHTTAREHYPPNIWLSSDRGATWSVVEVCGSTDGGCSGPDPDCCEDETPGMTPGAWTNTIRASLYDIAGPIPTTPATPSWPRGATRTRSTTPAPEGRASSRRRTGERRGTCSTMGCPRTSRIPSAARPTAASGSAACGSSTSTA